MNIILKKAYAGVFHFILGIVLASTAVIAPTDYSGISTGGIIVSVAVFLGGIALGLSMGWLEKKYKREE